MTRQKKEQEKASHGSDGSHQDGVDSVSQIQGLEARNTSRSTSRSRSRDTRDTRESTQEDSNILQMPWDSREIDVMCASDTVSVSTSNQFGSMEMCGPMMGGKCGGRKWLPGKSNMQGLLQSLY